MTRQFVYGGCAHMVHCYLSPRPEKDCQDMKQMRYSQLLTLCTDCVPSLLIRILTHVISQKPQEHILAHLSLT